MKYKDVFGVKFEGDYSSNLTSLPKDFDVLIYNTPEEILNKFWGCDEDYEGDHGFNDGKGNEIILSHAETIDNIKEMGVWGFVGDKKDIHIWIDFDTVDDTNFMSFISHEIGHLQKPYKKDLMEEEMKAEHYSDITSCSYFLFMAIKERLLNFKKE